MRLDPTGKVSLDHIYTEPDPRAYFTTLRVLDYQVPQQAKPHFARLIERCREAVAVPTVVDIGCSYGINAALLRCDVSMSRLYDRYGRADRLGLSREEVLAADRELVRATGRPDRARFVGLDVSRQAAGYGLAAGFLDDVVLADLERDEPTARQRAQLDGADLVVSTGCVGYVTERTIGRVVAACGERLPVMAHFVLRMFPFAPIAEHLAELGYRTVSHPRLFRQRRFAGREEQQQVTDTLAGVGVDPSGLEDDGWLYAQLHVSKPHGGNGFVRAGRLGSGLRVGGELERG